MANLPAQSLQARRQWVDIHASGDARQHNGDVYSERDANPESLICSSICTDLYADVFHSYASDAKNGDDRKEQMWRSSLRDWLTFAEIGDRREQIHEAHPKTFRWIFEEGKDAGFLGWLQYGSGIFWVRGKPASCKSTLMKYIADEPRLRSNLRTWTGDKRLLAESFWFRATGTQLQTSLVGLYRTLLYNLLNAEHDLCRIAFPEWHEKFLDVDPTLPMLTAALKNVVASLDAGNTCMFFIIDGLDEYESDSIGKSDLAELMLSLTRSSKVKLLLSSRPEIPFETCFKQCPSIRLETLTQPDILAYVEAKLWSNPSVRELTATEREDITGIANAVVQAAAGVFLWVVIVVSIALDGINSHESFSLIHQRIKSLPPQLDNLFSHILLERIPRNCRAESFRSLLTVLIWQTSAGRGIA